LHPHLRQPLARRQQVLRPPFEPRRRSPPPKRDHGRMLQQEQRLRPPRQNGGVRLLLDRPGLSIPNQPQVANLHRLRHSIGPIVTFRAAASAFPMTCSRKPRPTSKNPIKTCSGDTPTPAIRRPLPPWCSGIWAWSTPPPAASSA